MAHLQYMPGDPRLVDQLVFELKSKGIFDQFRKECIADVDTRPAYQNLRQRVENSVSTFLTRQAWKPDLNKNQLREKLRKHILDGNYLEQGVERIVDQVVNPKVASVFIPQVEDLVYNYLGITRKKAPGPGTSEKKHDDLLPTDLEAVSPGSVKSNDDKNNAMDIDYNIDKMEIDHENIEIKEEKTNTDVDKKDVQIAEVTVNSNGSESMDKSSIPLPAEEINLENIPAPVNSPPKVTKLELESIALPHEPNLSTDIPLPDEAPKQAKDPYFKPIQSDDSSSSSDSSMRRNMSPLTPIRNFNNENSCDAQQGFDDNSEVKSETKAAPSSFRFTIETTDTKSNEHNSDMKANDHNSDIKTDKKDTDIELSYKFNNQVHINTFNTPMYDDSSNSNNLHIDYESDVNSKTNTELKPEIENSEDSKKEKKSDDRKSSHKSSHRSRDSSRHSSSKHKRSNSKHSTSRDSSRHDKKSSSTKDDKYRSSKEAEKSKERGERKDSRDSSKHRSSYKSSNTKEKDSKSHRSSSSSHRHSSKSVDEKKSSSSKEKPSESSRDKSSKDRSSNSKSSSHRSDKDRKSSTSSSKKSDDKDKKKDKRDLKDTDDHYSLSGRGNHGRRSTDRDSNDGSSSSKGSQQQNGSKSSESKKESKSSSSKSETTSASGDSASPSDKEHIVHDNSKISQFKPIVRVDNHLETPIANPPRLPFVPDVTLKKPRFAANLQEARKLMKMRKFLDEEQKRMNQEAALLLEFQANVRPSLSQVYSSISGPELEFACVSNDAEVLVPYEAVNKQVNEQSVKNEVEQTVEDKSADVEVANISEVVKASEIEDIKCNVKEKKPIDTPTIDIKKIVEKEDCAPMAVKCVKLETPESPEVLELKEDNSYDENKPFSELMDEITEYSKASETKTDIEEPKLGTGNSIENEESLEIPQNSVTITETTNCTEYLETKETTESMGSKYFEVTIITEELSDTEELELELKQDDTLEEADLQTISNQKTVDRPLSIQTEYTTSSIATENLEKSTPIEDNIIEVEKPEKTPKLSENELQYFAEHEKYSAELERHEFSNFLKGYIEKVSANKKMFLINCDKYEENIVKEVASTFGDYEVVNYYKNGYLKLPKSKNIVKDVTLSNEITLPMENRKYEEKSPFFSPVRSECSFELSNDYDTKLDDINKKSRQEVLEIILGTITDASPSKMPRIDYYTESTIENEIDYINTQVQSEIENTVSTVVESETDNSLKRSLNEVESSVNNNIMVLTPNKIRKLSESDQISSTTEETDEASNNNKVSISTRSKYLGRAKRVGLPRPKRCNIASSPSSDKSVENYILNTPVTPPATNGKIKITPRTKIQRYDTSDLYKPKLHYLSRRNNVT